MGRKLITVLLITTLAGPAAWGDVVVLKDGSRVIGDVTSLMEGKLILQTQFAGELTIEREHVASIETAGTVNVEMDTGDRFVGPVEVNEEVGTAMIETEFGGVPITFDRVEAMWQLDANSPEEIAFLREYEQMQAEFEAARPKWKFTAEAGFTRREGNTDTADARGRIELTRTSDVDLFRYYISGQYGEDDGVRNTSEAKTGIYYEHLIFMDTFNDRMYAYGQIDFEYDEFENLDLRTEAVAGLGYYFIREAKHELKGRAGAGFRHESYSDDTNETSGLAEAGADYRVDLAEWLRFTHSATWRPSWEDIADYRLIFDTAVLIPLADSEQWKLKLGVLKEYDSQPSGGAERMDSTYYANIQLNIE